MGNRNEEMEKGGPGTGLQSYIEKPSSRRDLLGKLIHHHHSTARRAEHSAYAKCAEQGAKRLRREHHSSMALGRVANDAY